MNVSLQGLKVFESAARLGSFKAAAEELALSPTSVSHHVRRLEQRLKVDLFYRRVRGVGLTPSGEKLSEALTNSFLQIQQAVDDVAELGNRIKINTTSAFAALVLVPELAKFNQAAPSINIDVATGEDIRSEANGLSVRFGQIPFDSKDYFYHQNRLLHRDKYSLFGTPECLNRIRQGQTQSVLLTRWKNKELPLSPWLNWCKASDFECSEDSIVYFDQELLGIYEAIAGKGLVFCSTLLVRSFVCSGVLKAYTPISVPSELGYYLPEKSLLGHPAQAVVLEWLEKLFTGEADES
ncbi:LysR family transcriptional regulator [Oceanospirillum sanctuarii]|uniref:LysR family transcriptional regulator n=1 Tax=Oceanospirillum sanctuarii TaxID=1434821 RepID=UPI000A3B1A59|nr:LysR family transcriptional regulator [Oceanospirillum sanctuarii]